MKRKNDFRIKKIWQGIVVGIIVGIIATVSCILLLAAILVKYDVPADTVKYLLFVPAVISGFISGGVAGKFVSSKGFLWGLVSALSVSVIFVLVLILINAFYVHFLTLLLIPVYALTGSIGGIIASNLK